jgi:hypothetical protein
LERGERFLVLEGEKPIAALGPVEEKFEIVAKPGGFLERAPAFRAKIPYNPTPIKEDIEFGRL